LGNPAKVHLYISFAVSSLEAFMTFNPFEQQEEEIEGSMDLEMIRDDLVAELKSINEYEAQVEMLDSEEAADAIEQILEDKKVHVAKLVKLLKLLDPVQAEKLNNELR
jgi:rubrerythrin